MTNFGKLAYFRTDEIMLPIMFGENMYWFEKSDMTIAKVSGSDPVKMCYCVNNKVENGAIRDDKYKAIFQPAHGTAGAIFVDITGEVVKKTDLMGEFAVVDPVLISYNRLPVAIKDMSTPYKTSDGWWNVFIAFEYPVVGFGIHTVLTGIDHKQDFIYRGMSLDVPPPEPPPPFSAEYSYAVAQKFHCVGDWATVDLQSDVQAKYFWLKLNGDDRKMPEVLLKDPQVLEYLTPVSVAPCQSKGADV